ncbi:MAG: response regulator [Methylotenera sp.]|nr:response regulator [Oligoflexia bacterium]
MRTSIEIQDEIVSRFGFFPPFFAPALGSPPILENLWQQTLSAYVDNPLPALFKEKLAAIVSRSCSVPYCLVCHSCTLRPLGMKAGDVLDLLEQWPTPSTTDRDRSLQLLDTHPVSKASWPEANSSIEDAILHLSTLITLGDDDVNFLAQSIIRVVGKSNYDFLCLFMAYNKTCLIWAETHQAELSYDADQRTRNHLQPLLDEEPRLAEFFSDYKLRFNNASKYSLTKRELEKSEANYRKLNQDLEKRINLRTEELEKELAERMRGEHELKDSQVRLRTVLDNAPLILWAADQQGVVTYSDGKGLRKLGLEPGQLVGQSIFELYRDSPASVTALNRALAGESLSVEAETGDIHFDSHYAPVHDMNGKITGMVGFSTDVTERKISEIARADALLGEATALEASRMKSNFLATMSHEIRTPINGVIGMTSLLLDTSLDNEQKSYAEAVRSSADTLLTLINDILDLSKAEAGKVDLELIDFELDHLVLDIERTLTFAAKKKGLKFYRSISTDLPTHFKGDPTRLRQVIVNLVNNAIKFTARGQVTLEVQLERVEGEKTFLRFEVSDTGIGIPEEVVSRLFQPFSQADTTTTRKFGGTGLGLSISKHLVNLMGGEIGVRSQAGNGATFWFTVPLDTGAVGMHGKAEVCYLPNRHAKLRILVAEDNSVNQIIAVKMLEKLGHTAVAVANGQEAIQALSQISYDLVFMDCQMPELDGYEATRRIRQEETTAIRIVPIVAMTANAMNGDREKCLAAGMNDYISKPMKLADLDAVIETTMGKIRRIA